MRHRLKMTHSTTFVFTTSKKPLRLSNFKTSLQTFGAGAFKQRTLPENKNTGARPLFGERTVAVAERQGRVSGRRSTGYGRRLPHNIVSHLQARPGHVTSRSALFTCRVHVPWELVKSRNGRNGEIFYIQQQRRNTSMILSMRKGPASCNPTTPPAWNRNDGRTFRLVVYVLVRDFQRRQQYNYESTVNARARDEPISAGWLLCLFTS
ncbi:hypothetical protein J6590_014632 [Homalodisca vitripennis]|nr:hypothetical protein J6590_014632 [Homalodisca vitripennis]